MDPSEYEKRKALVHLVRSGASVAQAAKELGRSRAWGHKWWQRFEGRQDWEALRDQSRRPKHQPKKLPEQVRQAIRRARSELEAEAQEKDRLGYVGAYAIQARLKEKNLSPLPSISSIERELRKAGMVRVRSKKKPVEIHYPHLHPTRPHQLNQADIVPRYLTGGTAIACFNAIDVVSRYPSGRRATPAIFCGRSGKSRASQTINKWTTKVVSAADLPTPGYLGR